MKKLAPIGLHDFKEIREKNYYYVDKTAIIKEIFESGKVVLLTRPRRFGKTLTLSMLYYFFSQSTSSYASLFLDTAIWKLPEYQALQGSYPVIFVSFRTVSDTTFEIMLKQLAYL